MKVLTEDQKTIISQMIADSGDYLVRKYIDEITKSISDVWSVEDVIDYCVNHAEVECDEEQALDVLEYMESRHDVSKGYTWDGMATAVERIIVD